jgi:two-component system, sensor histidine kinase PdtaS
MNRSLIRMWGLVADLGFCDLLLVEPIDATHQAWTITAQIRPTTHQTLYTDDLVGTTISLQDRPALSAVWNTSHHVDSQVTALCGDGPTQSRAIPVPDRQTYPSSSNTGAVVLCEEAIDFGRRRGLLERTYLEIFDQFASMISSGRFPYAEEFEPLHNHRVGDGVIVFDDEARVRFASPNATSALHRLGVLANPIGQQLDQLGLQAAWLKDIKGATTPISGEVTTIVSQVQSSVGLLPALTPTPKLTPKPGGLSETLLHSTVVGVYLIPLVTGSMLLLRDVTDERRKDRLIVSKDATIREVHHRVKNNLQTISALLRLQGRRMESVDARAAIDDSVRRIRSMALVHETLSQGITSAVPFNEVIRPLLRIVEEGIQGADRPIRFVVHGHAGELPAEIATPLSIVLVELLQNSVEHGYPAQPQGKPTTGSVSVTFERTESLLRVVVQDDGVGFPDGFSLSTTRSLGLTIVRTLITSELGGVISTSSNDGAVVDLRLPFSVRH